MSREKKYKNYLILLIASKSNFISIRFCHCEEAVSRRSHRYARSGVARQSLVHGHVCRFLPEIASP